MAKIPDGILSGFRGRIGNIVGVKRYGEYYIRAVSKTPRKPNTPAQKKQCTKFGVCSKLTKRLKPYLRITYGAVAGKNWNSRFISYNVHSAVRKVEDGLEVNFPNLLLSAGHLKPADNPKADRTADGDILYKWTDNSGEGNARETDKAVLLAIHPEGSESVFLFDGPDRTRESAVLPLPHYLKEEPVHVYLSMMTKKERLFSNSEYLGFLK